MEKQNAENQAEQVKSVVRAILSRSATNFEFRHQLLTDPRSAVAEYLGVDASELPEPFSLAFTEEPRDGAVTLPDYLGPDAELGGDPAEAARLAYGREKHQRLAALKDRYDPGNLFRHNLNVPPGRP